MSLIADIFVTIRGGREDLTARSLRSLRENTTHGQYRLTLCFDGTSRGERHDLETAFNPAYSLSSDLNEGLGPTINRAVAHIKSVNDWYSDPKASNMALVAPYLCMVQDDVQYSKDWLPVLASRFRAYGMQYKLGFASGIECVEHPVRQSLMHDGSIVLKDWLRATMMLSTREYWESMMPIPRFDPETGQVRAKPNDGMGSGVDWWVIRDHENSVCRTGRTNLVLPGLCQHMGYAQSTWLKREMPESDSDKEKIG